MKKLTLLLLIMTIALVGCGRESEQIDADATQTGDSARTLTIAWHKVSEDDGSICELSTATHKSVEQAFKELSQTLAPNGMKVAVETLSPEKVEGSECLCNRVLIQGRFVDEWLGADLVKTACSGCPNQAGCAKSAGSGGGCGGQYAMIHQGKTYSIVPANLIVMAGIIAAADLTGEEITYSGCPGHGACKGECICANCGSSWTCGKCEGECICADCGGTCTYGKCDGGCKYQAAGANCPSDCPGMVTGSNAPCQGSQAAGIVTAERTTAAATAKQGGCPRAAQCKNAGCPSKASGR